MNGYYGMGQIYGYISAKLSLYADYRLDIYRANLVDISASFQLNFGGPNPTWIDGSVSIKKQSLYDVPFYGSLAKGAIYALEALDVLKDSEDGYTDIDFHVQRGEPCELSRTRTNGSTNTRGNENIVSYIMPAENDERIRLIEANQAIKVLLNKPLNEIWSVTRYKTNTTTEIYKFKWELSISLKQGTTNLSHTLLKVPDGNPTELQLFINDPRSLRVGQAVSLRLTFKMKQSSNNGSTWQDKEVDDAARSTQIYEATFTIAPESLELSAADVATAYPAQDQRYYLQGPASMGSTPFVSQGFVKLTQKNSELASGKYLLTTKIYADNQLVQEGDFTYTNYTNLTAGAALKYTLPRVANNADIRVEFYAKLKIVTIPGTTQSQPSPLPSSSLTVGGASKSTNSTSTEPAPPTRVFTLNFHTSQYNTFAEKMATVRNPKFYHESSDSYHMTTILKANEPFEDWEVGSNPRDRKPVMRATIPLNTPWHTAMRAVCQAEENQGFSAPTNFFSTQYLGTDLSNGSISIAFDIHEVIRSEMERPEKLTKPTAGDYNFTMEYQSPILKNDGSIGIYSPSASTTTTTIGGATLTTFALDLGNKTTVRVPYEGYEAALVRQAQDQVAQQQAMSQAIRNAINGTNQSGRR